LLLGQLQQIPFFAGLPDTRLKLYETWFTSQNFGRRQQVAFEQWQDDVIFFVLSGRVKVSYFSEDGQEFIVGLLGAGQVYSRHSEAVITAMEETEAAFIRTRNFTTILTQNPELYPRLIKVLGQVLRTTNEAIQNLAFREVSSRLAAFLLERAGEEDAFVLDLTHEDLANLLGSRRQTITATLNRWSKAGVLLINRQKITILDRQRLTALL